MKKMRLSLRSGGQVLLMSLVLLAVLSLIAVLTLRSLGLNLRAAGDYGAQLSAFEASEAARGQLLPLLRAHLQSRGWPRRWGGDVDDSVFAQVPASITLAGGLSRLWYLDNSESSAAFSPLALDIDARFDRDYGDAQAPLRLQADLAVYRLRAVALDSGNAAFAQAYEGSGQSLAAGGGAVLFYVHSEAREVGSEASAITGAVYRYVTAP